MAVTAAELLVRVGADTKAAEEGLHRVSGLASGAGKALLGLGAAAGGALAVGLGASVAAAAGFEQTMSGVKAVSGATAEELQQLSGLALQLGKDTSFSASEAAAGIEELVKGGLSVADVLGGGAKAALDLAAAGSVSLSEAANVAANALNQFGLTGADLPHVADLIAGAANAATLEVGDFKFSLQAAGAVAATVGFSFDDLAQGIAMMGKAGIIGADAGTSLKAMMMNLVPSTDKAAGLMRELGLITFDTGKMLELARRGGFNPAASDLDAVWRAAVAAHAGLKDVGGITAKHIKDFSKASQELGVMSNAFFDAKGNVKSMADVAQLLQDKIGGLTREEQIKVLRELFGSDAIRAGAVLLKEGAAGFDQMAAAMGKVTAASVGAERLNNLMGDVEQLKGSAETAAITLGQNLQPALRAVTQGATGMVNSLIPLIKTHGPALSAMIVSLGGHIPPVVDAITTFIGAISGTWQPAPGISQFHQIVGEIGLGIAAVRDGVITFTAALQGDWQPAPGITQFHLIVGQLGLAIPPVIAAVTSMASAVQQNDVAMAALVGVLTAGATAYGLMTAASIAHTAATNAVALATRAYTAAQTALNVVLTANPIGIVVVALAGLAAGLIYAYNHSEQFRNAVNGLWAAAQEAGGHIAAFAGIVHQTVSAAFALAMTVVQEFQRDFPGTLARVALLVGAAVDTFKAEALKLGWSVVQGIVSGIGQKAGELFESLRTLAGSALEAAKNAIQARSPSRRFAQEVGAPMVEGIIAGIQSLGPRVGENLSGILTGALRIAQQTADGLSAVMAPALARLTAAADEANRMLIGRFLGPEVLAAWDQARDRLTSLDDAMGLLGQEIRTQEGLLADYKRQLQPMVNTLNLWTDRVNKLKDALSSAQQRLRDFASAPLAGENAQNQTIFGLENALNILRFQRADRKNAGADDDDEQVKALDKEIDLHERRLEVERLRARVDFDGKRNALQQMANSSKELTFETAVAGIIKAKEQIALIQGDLLPRAIAEQDQWKAVVAEQNQRIIEQQGLIDTLKGKYSELADGARAWHDRLKEVLDTAREIKRELEEAEQARKAAQREEQRAAREAEQAARRGADGGEMAAAAAGPVTIQQTNFNDMRGMTEGQAQRVLYDPLAALARRRPIGAGGI